MIAITKSLIITILGTIAFFIGLISWGVFMGRTIFNGNTTGNGAAGWIILAAMLFELIVIFALWLSSRRNEGNKR
jgi:membrane protein DedA with SNARE-associated domain